MNPNSENWTLFWPASSTFVQLTSHSTKLTILTCVSLKVSSLPDLISLNLSNNCIINIVSPAKKGHDPQIDSGDLKWKSLVYLDLSFNKITDVDELRFPQLKELNLNNNEVKKIENLENCENLENLKLSNNLIADLSKFRGTKNLKKLYLVN